ncbi:hypothetical protein GJ699_20505 [Duganella sp. FT80W]|uniref:Uncharacterized protein n=1 Tax=Duganella guangzhouensis TaxID=2666084 RepID=A0A6I2L3J1_9BURK|nr:hypothetical protein [Duganella guangzhouensis]MRW92382.1 hypothetical protein [Duganella guangzhouensis]
MSTAIYDLFALTPSAQLALHPSLAGYTGLPVEEVRAIVLAEHDHNSALSVLACVEAALRTDYLKRCYTKQKDDIARSFRDIYKKRAERARLDDDILACWRDSSSIPKVLIGELIGAFNYRHWLAHGRYWTQKFGRLYDYPTVYTIADAFLEAMKQHE